MEGVELVQANAVNALSSFSKLSKTVAAILAGSYVLYLLLPLTAEYLALAPGKTLPYVWQLLTASFYEMGPISVLFNAAAILQVGRTVEPIWGTRETAKYILTVGITHQTLLFFTSVFLFMLTRRAVYLYSPMGGFHGVSLSFTVVMKQLFPDAALPHIPLTAKWVPSCTIIVAIALGILGVLKTSIVLKGIFGIYCGWCYLRFFQVRTEGVSGDPSETFEFATFFPDGAQPHVSRVSNILYNLFCQRRDNEYRRAPPPPSGPLPGSDPTDANRRRERGARALEERLAATGSTEADSQMAEP